jgi:hypothetical protein
MADRPRRLVIAIENMSLMAMAMAVLTGFIWGAALTVIICGRIK